MLIKVLKFGGSSQETTTYDMIYDIINDDTNSKYVIVLSAIKGVTNKLLEFVKTKNYYHWNDVLDINKKLASRCVGNSKVEFIKQMENKMWDFEKDKVEIVAMGEFFTTNILNSYLNEVGVSSCFLSSFEVIHSNQPNFGMMYNKGEFSVDTTKIFDKLNNHKVVIVPGFSGLSSDNQPCLLGRGGSDTTGSIIAAAIDSSVYEIWTDVNGIYSSDPRIISGCKIIDNIGYNAAQEIAAMGAKVIHPFCILPCANKKIPIVIKNTFEPYTEVNTIISQNNSKYSVYAVTLQSNVKVFKITSLNMWNNFGFVYDIFSIFKKYNVDVNIINTSQFNITTTTEDTHIDNLMLIKEELSRKYNVELLFDYTIVSVIGENIRKYPFMGDVFEISQKYDMLMTSYSSNDMTLSWVIDSHQSNHFAQELHDKVINRKPIESILQKIRNTKNPSAFIIPNSSF